MAAVTQYTHFRSTPPIDGLCPHCFNPALKLYHYQKIDMTGITPLGTRVACVDCKKFIAPVIPHEQELTK